MTIETDLVAALDALCGGRCYADVAPAGTATPFITYQQVGGKTVDFIEGGPATKRNARIQVTCWHSSRGAVNALMRQVEDALQSAPFYGQPDGALIARVEEGAPLKGSHQDFSLWWS